MSSTGFDLHKLTAPLGAEITGLDLSRPLDDETRRGLELAWREHLVLFFRDQHLTADQHIGFAESFGDIYRHPVEQPLKVAGHPDMFVLESDAERPFVAERWHTDVTFEPEPPMGAILRAVEVPEAGGDTMWASMHAAYDALSDRMQRLLSDLQAVHGPGRYARTIADSAQQRYFDERPPVVHPVIRTHPVTKRKGIFVNPVFTERIEDLHDRESQHLLDFLFDHVASPEFHCRFHWTPGAVAMWDNRCTQHRVVADRPEAHRVMHRLTLTGDRPY